jgi:hypothetical protein
MVWTYLKKPSALTKLTLGLIVISSFYILQATKMTYREQIKSGDAGLGSFSAAVSKNTDGEGLFSISNFAGSITRANQGWIFASSVNRMNFKQDFQGLIIVKKYAEAAILPRVLAPDKMQAGDKKIFNQFSGAKVGKGTSMGLGILADGYVAYGAYGTLIFAFILGWFFAIIFKILESWSKISPFFVLFVFTLLNYAVRADCETQTIMGHLVKGLLVFSCLFYYYKKYINKQLLSAETTGSDNSLVISGN